MASAKSNNYYLRKFFLRRRLADNNIWNGSIDTFADTEEELPNPKDIRGIFSVKKDESGWSGWFSLDTGTFDKRTSGSCQENNFIKTISIRRAKRALEHTSIGKSDEMVSYETLKFQGRLEDAVFTYENFDISKLGRKTL